MSNSTTRKPRGTPMDVLVTLAGAAHVWVVRAAWDAIMSTRAGAMPASAPDIALRVSSAGAAVLTGLAAFVIYRRLRASLAATWLLAAAVVAPVCALACAYGGVLAAMRMSSPAGTWTAATVCALAGAAVPYRSAFGIARCGKGSGIS